MKIDDKLLNKLENIALIKLKSSERKEILTQLSEVLEAFSKLKEVDTKNIQPAFLPIDVINNLREDSIRDCLTQEEALSNSKHKYQGYFKSPKPFEK